VYRRQTYTTIAGKTTTTTKDERTNNGSQYTKD
jgi:hypothetical protein